MTSTLAYLAPRAWVEAQPASYGTYYDRAEHRRIAHLTTKKIVSDWENYFFGRLVSQALRYLNTEHFIRRAVPEWIAGRLQVEAVRAGQDVGVRFTSGRSRAWAKLDGELSTGWLEREIRQAVEFAIEQWNPTEAEAVRTKMSNRAKAPRPNRTPKYPTSLLAGIADRSPSAQSEILGIPIATIHRMRNRLDIRSGVVFA